MKSLKGSTIYCSTSLGSKILPTLVWWGARSCPREMSVKFRDYAELISLIDFRCSCVDGFLPNGPSQKLKKHRVRVFEAKKQFLLYAAWGFATDRQGGPCWMLVDTKEQKRLPPLLHSLFPCKFCKSFFLYRMTALSRGCKSLCQHIYIWDLSLYAKLRYPLDF